MRDTDSNGSPDARIDAQRRTGLTSTTTLLSALLFFLLLYGYYLLRPLREAMGIDRSMSDLRGLFLTTCVVSLAVSVAFGSLVARANPRRCITIGYRAVIACLVIFAISLLTLPDRYTLYSGYVFYVWISVVNLFMISVFWSLMADTWTLKDAKRLYPAIGVGGTLGAMLGSMTAAGLAERLNPVWFILLAAICFELAVRTMRRIHATGQRGVSHPAIDHAKPVGGSWHEGVTTLVRSPYLMGIGLYITFIAISSTLIYFTQARIIVDARDELDQRVALFAQLDMYTQIATLLVQVFVTAQLIKRLGIGLTLCVLPVVTLLGFGVLAWVSARPGIEAWQVFAVFAVFNAVHRASRYAVIRPARETLFSVVSRQEKYKAKPVIDVFLYRGGDVAGTGIENALAGMALGLWGMFMVAAPLAVLWSGLAIMLAVMQHRSSASTSNNDSQNNLKMNPNPSNPQEALL